MTPKEKKEFVSNKQTAVEFLMDKLFDGSTMVDEQLKWFEQAKQMEKQQLKWFLEWYNDDPFGEIGAMSYDKAVKEYLKTL